MDLGMLLYVGYRTNSRALTRGRVPRAGERLREVAVHACGEEAGAEWVVVDAVRCGARSAQVLLSAPTVAGGAVERMRFCLVFVRLDGSYSDESVALRSEREDEWVRWGATYSADEGRLRAALEASRMGGA